ncbi:MAG: hypothetical protein ACR2MY_12240 [Candidatus Dormibacteria bacterium]
MSEPLPSPKSRLRAVYTVPSDAPRRSEKVVYQLEDTGHPSLRLRPSVRLIDDDGQTRFLYRVLAYSRITGLELGVADRVAPLGSQEEFAADAREFQSEPFLMVIDELSAELVAQFGEAEATAPAPE